MRKDTLLIDLQYLPPLEFFVACDHFPKVLIDAHEHYEKQSYRNRCRILTANKVLDLSIPAIGGNKKIRARDVRIDYQQKWLHQHWRAIISAYGKAPYFDFFAQEFHQVFFKKLTFLFDLNWQLLTLCLKLLQIEKSLAMTSEYLAPGLISSDLADLRSKIHPKKGHENNMIYQPCNYNQIFGKNFVANLSIIDLLFCEGLRSRDVLMRSKHPGFEQLIL